MSLWMCQHCAALQGYNESMRCPQCGGVLQFTPGVCHTPPSEPLAASSPPAQTRTCEECNEPFQCEDWSESRRCFHCTAIQRRDEEIDKLRAALSASPLAWEPIASAPKDGTPILGWSGHSYEVAVWNHASEMWLICDGEYSFDPTHWMRLPDPPKVQR